MSGCKTSIEIEYWMNKATRKSMQGETYEPDTAELEQEFQLAMRLPAGLELHFQAALEHVVQHTESMLRPRSARY
jgi:hypothetical protein